MANDRLWLKCKNCGETKLLAKYYPTLVADPCGGVGEWALGHMLKCSPAAKNMSSDLKGDNCFDVVTDKQEMAERNRGAIEQC